MKREEAEKILGCTPESTPEEIKKKFKKLAFKLHPDRPEGSEEAFMHLNKAYEVISKTKQEKSITKNMFDRFRSMYENSLEEKEELISLYTKYKGNMEKVIDNMLLGEDAQEERYRDILQKEIEEKKIEEYPQYKKKVLRNKRRQKKREKEAEEAEALAQQIEASRRNREERWNKMIEKLEDQVSKDNK